MPFQPAGWRGGSAVACTLPSLQAWLPHNVRNEISRYATNRNPSMRTLSSKSLPKGTPAILAEDLQHLLPGDGIEVLRHGRWEQAVLEITDTGIAYVSSPAFTVRLDVALVWGLRGIPAP